MSSVASDCPLIRHQAFSADAGWSRLRHQGSQEGHLSGDNGTCKKWGSVALSALLMSQIIMVVTILIVSGSTWLISLINKSPRQVMASYPIYKWMNWFGYDPLTKWDDPPSIVMAH